MTASERPVWHLVNWMRKLLPHCPEAISQLEASVTEDPERIDNSYTELFSGYNVDPATILKPTAIIESGSYPGTVSSWDIPFLSFCAHHFAPFFGTVDVHYVPNKIIIGIGKIPRLVRCRANRFQLQEYLVRDIANDLFNYADADAVEVVAHARHVCVCYRGPNVPTVSQSTVYRLGNADKIIIVPRTPS